MSGPEQDHVSPQTRLSGCLVRLGWMLIGNGVLFISAVSIARNHVGFLSAYDAVFWVAPVVMVVLRYVDIRWLEGCKTDSSPATMSDWRRYTLALFGLCLAAWGLAHGIEYLSR